jgi:predicted acyltransferase
VSVARVNVNAKTPWNATLLPTVPDAMLTSAPPVASTPAPVLGVKRDRLRSLDVLRGITVATMILVNNPGDWGHIYVPLEHASWNGCTPTDLVFPFFLFMVGVALAFSLGRRRTEAAAVGRGRALLARKIVLRSTVLFLIGVGLYAIPAGGQRGILDLKTLRIMGVLQRIALCYFAAATLMLFVGWRGLAASTVLLLTAYSVLMLAVPVPGYGAGHLSLEGNLAAFVDAAVFGNHCYVHPPASHHYWDPEGLLSTLPAVATTLMGALAGLWLRSQRGAADRAAGLLAAGVAAATTGYVLNGVLMPVNKGLWTPSYVLLTGGYALLALGFCYWVIDVCGRARWAAPFLPLGMNALAVFVASGIIGRLTLLIAWTGGDGKPIALKTFLFRTVYKPWFPATPEIASLAYATTYLGIFALLSALLYRRRLFIRA